jgi:hypothetical protein
VRSLDRLLERLRHAPGDAAPGSGVDTAPVVIVLGDGSLMASAAIARRWLEAHRGADVIQGMDAARWPFTTGVHVPREAAVVWLPNLHEAFVNEQGSGTRLVTTQAGYQLLPWLADANTRGTLLLATADRASLEQHAPELLSGPRAPARRGRTGCRTTDR